MRIRLGRFSLTGFFFTIFLLEIFLGGAGRLTTIGPLTLRMYFFILGMGLLLLLLMIGKKITKTTYTITVIFTIILVIAIIQGIVNSENYTYLFADVKMVLFFFTLPLFDVLIKDYKSVEKIQKLLKWSTVILAILYFIFLIILHSGVYSFRTIWLAMSKPEYHQEFGFRGESAMIYKGFIYVCIGFFFFFFNKRSFKNIITTAFVFLAIVLTLSRAFILLVFLLTISYTLYKVIFSRKNKILNIIIISSIVIGGIALIPKALQMLGDKTKSDNIRVVQLQEVGEMVNPWSFFVGHGYGVGIPLRPSHMEIMYLEIFHKQGIFGLSFWFLLLVYIFIKYYNYYKYCKNNGIKDHLNAKAFLFGVVFLYAQSLFNPFLTNSMGMTFLFITLIIFEKLKTFNEQKSISMHRNI